MFYSDEVIDEVRQANDIVDVIGSYVKLKRSGSNYMGLCPFHSEKSPSFSVSRTKQMYYCFGCHRGGNVITFVRDYENLTFPEAIKTLADRAGIQLPEQEMSAEERRQRDERTALLEINRVAGEFYYYRLRSPEGKPGMDYLTKRGLSQETMRSFGLGYAGTYSDSLYRFLKKKGYSDELLYKSGLISHDERRGMYDKFWNRVMFPIMDLNNRVIGFGGRVMGDGKPKYLNSPETKIFDKSRNLYGLNVARRSRENRLILCEGYMDVISMHQAGFTNSVASLGTALTRQHCALLARYTKNIILSYDSDNPGVNAALRAIPMLRDAGLTPKILHLEPYKDPDEFIKALGHDAFSERLDQAENAFLFEIGILQRSYDLKDPDAKTSFYREVAKKIAAWPLQMERDNYLAAVSEKYRIDPSALKEMVMRELLLGAGEAYSAPAADGEGGSRTGDSYRAGDGFRSGGSGSASGTAAGGSVDYYEDAGADGYYQNPSTAVRSSRKGSVREQGNETSRALLLNYLTQYPQLYGVVRKYLRAEDFGNSIAGKAAPIIFAQIEKNGKADPAAVMDHFEEADDLKGLAELFHTLPKAENQRERELAVRETLAKVLSAAPISGDGAAQITATIERKRLLEKLRQEEMKL